MSDSPPSSIDRPARNLSAPVLGFHLFGLDLTRQIRSRKTILLFLVQLLPALIATIALFAGDRDGLEVFETTYETVYLPLLIPLAALFFGGPTVVDEVQGRTITYLTLRPLSRTTLFVGKLATSITLAVAVTVIPVVLFFLVCAIGAPASFGDSLALLGSATATTAFGAITYTAVFALLGVVFASTLLPGIVYYIVFEFVIASLPIIEFVSVKFHLFTLGGFERGGTDGDTSIRAQLTQALLDQPLEFDWWVGLVCLSLIITGAIAVSAYIFRHRQFHV